MLSANFKPKRIAAASRGFLAIARLSCFTARCTMCVARYCYSKSSVRLPARLSVCPSVTLMYRGHISFESNYVINQLRVFTPRITNIGNPVQREGNTPKFWRNRGGVALLSRKPAISLKRGKTGPKLLSRKFHTRFR